MNQYKKQVLYINIYIAATCQLLLNFMGQQVVNYLQFRINLLSQIVSLFQVVLDNTVGVKDSFEPELNQRPKDTWYYHYSPPLYQLSYRRLGNSGMPPRITERAFAFECYI